MTEIITYSIAELWVRVVAACVQEGAEQTDADVRLRELRNVHFTIRTPASGRHPAEERFDRDMLAAMHRNFHSDEPQFGYSISYGERIFWPESGSPYDAVRGLLQRKPETKSATICMIRGDDYTSGHVPCIAAVDFKIRDGRLHTYYFARSQDAFKKSYADNLAILGIAERLAGEVGSPVGELSATIASAHVYESDLAAAHELVRATQQVGAAL